MDFYETFAEIIREKGLTVPEVARQCGLTDSTVRSIFDRKQKKIALNIAFKISKGLNVSLERLNGEVDSAQNCDQDLTIDEKQLLDNYRSLNELGQELVRQQMELIVISDKYKKYAHIPNVEEQA